ncbi:hypothetical protein [Streptomyces sp. NPDC048442]|uniref:hypothetical protein n=1 Tax=Streptomyces sp. NPDC048442 TaxID=3154823 RepID=UPI0034252FA4
MPVLALLLAVVTACDDGTGTRVERTAPSTGQSAAQPPAGPHPLFKKQVRDQVSAAHSVTEKTGSAHFVSTLVYGSAKGDIVQRDEGDQDYTTQSASAEHTFLMPAAHPASLLEDLNEDTRKSRQSLIVADGDVLHHTSSGRWLRYSSAAGSEFAKKADEMLSHSGEAAPYRTPLSDILAELSAENAPKVQPDGTRRYTEKINRQSVGQLLPDALRAAIWQENKDGPTTQAPLTVDVDAKGRVTRIEANLDGVLPVLKKNAASHLPGVRTLRAQYTLTHFGRAIPAPAPVGATVDDAEKLLVALQDMKPGTCADSKDTGMKVKQLARPVDCGKRHDLRVFGQVAIDEPADGDEEQQADSIAMDECGRKYDSMPAGWRSDTIDNGYYTQRSDLSTLGDTLKGAYTCYFLTP